MMIFYSKLFFLFGFSNCEFFRNDNLFSLALLLFLNLSLLFLPASQSLHAQEGVDVGELYEPFGLALDPARQVRVCAVCVCFLVLVSLACLHEMKAGIPT